MFIAFITAPTNPVSTAPPPAPPIAKPTSLKDNTPRCGAERLPAQPFDASLIDPGDHAAAYHRPGNRGIAKPLDHFSLDAGRRRIADCVTDVVALKDGAHLPAIRAPRSIVEDHPFATFRMYRDGHGHQYRQRRKAEKQSPQEFGVSHLILFETGGRLDLSSEACSEAPIGTMLS